MSNYFRELSNYVKKCYGGYCSLCRLYHIEPVYYQRFADNFDTNTKTTFRLLHKGVLK